MPFKKALVAVGVAVVFGACGGGGATTEPVLDDFSKKPSAATPR